MTLQQLRYITMVAEKGTISEAAKELFISQPSLTNAIRELEQEMQVTIFHRTNKGVTITAEGDEFLAYARQILDQVGLMQERYLNVNERNPRFSVSCQHYSFAVNAFVDVIRKFDARKYDFTLRETQTYEIIEDVAKLKSEIGILYTSSQNETIIMKLIRQNDLKFENAVFVSGAVQMKEVKTNGNDIEITDEIMKEAKEEAARFFPECRIVGWGIIEDGSPMSRNREVKRIQEKEFAEEWNLFLWKNAREQEEVFYAYKFGEIMQMGGHYTYYEKNPEMQNYMINTRRENGVTPSEVVEDRAAKDFRSAVREKMEYKEQHQSSKFAYITSALLVLIVLVIGITTVNNFDKMKSVQTSLENLSKSMENGQTEEDTKTTTAAEAKEGAKEVSGTVKKSEEAKVSKEGESQLTDKDYYVVQKGETLAGISKKLYGDTSHVKAICKMNGLSDGNLIYIGQKLLLP